MKTFCQNGLVAFDQNINLQVHTGWLLYGGPMITKGKEPFVEDSGLFEYKVLLDIVLRHTMPNLKAVS